MKSMIDQAAEFIKNEEVKALREILDAGKLDPALKTSDRKTLDRIAMYSTDEIRDMVNDYIAVYGTSPQFQKAYNYIRKDDVENLTVSIAEGLPKDARDKYNRTLLFLALIFNSPRSAKALLNSGFGFDAEKRNPLLTAAYFSGKELVETLLEYLDCTPEIRREALKEAAETGNDEAFAALAEGVIVTPDEANSLLRASLNMKKGNPVLMNRLIDLGADPNLESEGQTPLMKLAGSAAWYSDEKQQQAKDLINMLVSRGADVNRIDQQGRKASDIAFTSENLEVGYLLRSFENYDRDGFIRKINEAHFPKDALEYLLNPENEMCFVTPKKLDAVDITLCGAEELRFSQVNLSTWEYRENYNVKRDPNSKKDGHYFIPVIDMIRKVNDYSAAGLLVWIPRLKMFGSFDTEHGVGYVFENTAWDEIISDIFSYVNIQWGHPAPRNGQPIYNVCEPWKLWEFHRVD